jgi:Putative prokaryotic signal transducing protein
MKELTRSNDMVFLSWARAFLADSGIGTMVLDNHTSVIEGSAGAIPRRLMVADRDFDRARLLLREATEPSS